tara:strand:- start:238 stop:426 length:189 start_codon:yes stop_codon:yes gene_type:complete
MPAYSFMFDALPIRSISNSSNSQKRTFRLGRDDGVEFYDHCAFALKYYFATCALQHVVGARK